MKGKRDSIYLFVAESSDNPIPDAREIKDVKFASISAPPDRTSPATLRRLEDIKRGAALSVQW